MRYLMSGFCLGLASLWVIQMDLCQRVVSQEQSPTGRRHMQSVYSFGAVGDGVADDTAAIQRAVDARIGEIRFPSGVFRITRPITVRLDEVGPISIVAHGSARVVMVAPGPAFLLIGTHQGTASPATVKANVWQRQRIPTIDGIEIVGQHPEASGIVATGTMQAIFTRISIRSALHGIHLMKRNRNVIISGCHIYDNRGIGVFLEKLNLHQINITNCHISYNDQGGIVARESEIRNLQISNCDIEANMDEQADPTANILIDTSQGTVREGAIIGCTIQHLHTTPNSANVRFLGRSAAEPQKIGHFAIANNAMSDVAVNIEMRHVRGVTITGNTLWKAFKQNLLVEGSSNVVIGPNLFDRNPDYRPADSPNGLLFRDCTDCTLSGLHINNTLSVPAGLILERCRWFNVTGCSILDCDHAGVLLTDVENSQISDCVVRNHQSRGDGFIAIRVTGGQKNLVQGNVFAGKVDIDTGTAQVTGNSID